MDFTILLMCIMYVLKGCVSVFLNLINAKYHIADLLQYQICAWLNEVSNEKSVKNGTIKEQL